MPRLDTFKSIEGRLLALMGVIGVAALALVWFGLFMVFNNFAKQEALDTAFRWAEFLHENLDDFENSISLGLLSQKDQRLFNVAGQMGNVQKYNVFNAEGRIVISTWSGDLGRIYKEPYFTQKVMRGESYSHLEEIQGEDGNPQLLISAYAPFMGEKGFAGAVEVYVDFTRQYRIILAIRNYAIGITLFLLLVIGGLMGMLLVRHNRDRNRSEKAVQESRRLLQTVFDNIPAGVFVKGRDGRFFMVNQSFAQWAGRDPASMHGMSGPELGMGSGEENDEREADDRKVLETGQRVENTFERVTDLRGEIQWRHVIKVPLLDGAGNITGLLGIRWNTTELVLATERLRESERLLQAIFDTLPYGIFVKDRESRLLKCNHAFARLHGIPAEQLAGLRAQDLDLSPQLIQKVLAEDLGVMETGQRFEELGRLFHYPAAGDVFMDVIKLPFANDNGEIVGLVGIQLDVTQRKELEAQLLQSQRLESVGLLAGGVAHEFNNLLQIILGFTQLILDQTPSDDPRVRNLETIVSTSTRGADLVKNLLAFSRQQPLHPRAMEPREVIDPLRDVLKATMPEHISIDLQSGEGTWRIHADPAAIDQILMNLCINARDAMPDGGRLVLKVDKVSFRETPSGFDPRARTGDFVRITVTDTGEGMPEEVLERIFEPFYTTKGPQQGSGLGLSLIYGLVEELDGFIQVDSVVGKGTSFALHFPALPEEAGRESPGETPPAGPSDSDPPPGPKPPRGEEPSDGSLILVSEDEVEVQNLTALILEEEGYRVLRAQNGSEAVHLFTENADRIDLVLLDLVMPKMGGREVYDRLQTINAKVPVIFHSGYQLNNEDSTFLQQRGLCLLQKPYHSAQLLKTVRETLSREP